MLFSAAGRKARRTLRMLIQIEYLPDGTWIWECSKPDTRKKSPHKKWRLRSAGGYEAIPAPADLRAFQAPGPIGSLVAAIGHDVHCLSIAAKKKRGGGGE